MIYCVEDDSNIRELEVYTLQSVGFKALGIATSAELFEALKQAQPELIILDIMLPDLDGITILKKLRNNPQTAKLPVIMATAKGSEFDKVTGLDSGADDYLAKPFGVMEMVSRVKAVLRRSDKVQSNNRIHSFGSIELDPQSYTVAVNGKIIELTLKEFELLKLFLQAPRQVFTRDRLLNEIWGYEYTGETRTVDVHVRTLRQKLGKAGDAIATVRGVGYRLMDSDTAKLTGDADEK